MAEISPLQSSQEIVPGTSKYQFNLFAYLFWILLGIRMSGHQGESLVVISTLRVGKGGLRHFK